MAIAGMDWSPCQPPVAPADVVAGGWRLELQRGALVRPDGGRREMTPTSLRLLQLLMSEPGRMWRLEEIMHWVYGGGGTAGQLGNVRAMVARVRRQVGPLPIRVRYGLGYSWEEGERCQPRV